MADDVFSRVIHSTQDKQIRLTVNNFRDVDYLHLREYYMDFDETWKPSSKGVSMPLSISNSRELFTGLLEILSLAEGKELITEHFKDILDTIYA